MAAMSGPAHGRGVLLHHLGQGLDPGQKTKPIHAEMDCVHRVRHKYYLSYILQIVNIVIIILPIFIPILITLLSVNAYGTNH